MFIAYLFLMLAGALGAGTLILRAVGLTDRFSLSELCALAFALGVGAIGWVTFFLAVNGYVNTLSLTMALGLMAPGLVFLVSVFQSRNQRRNCEPEPFVSISPIVRLALGIGIVLVLGGDLLEGLAPPADGDSLAYHFALPKAILAEGRLVPIYQAIEGTIPLLLQMTYMVALGTGGETTMTLWTMATGWGCAAMVYVTARRYLSLDWSLAITLVFLSTPAIVYGAGSGQIEVRNAMFVLAALILVAEARRTAAFRYTIIAGVAAGFFMASKYTGLIFAFACGCMVLLQRRWLIHGSIYSVALLAVGAQWYVWNYLITGDPIFPLLYSLADYRPQAIWDADIHAFYRSGITEKPLAVNLFWLFGYPLKATLDAHPVFESLRVGFGPMALVLLPFSCMGFWLYRRGLWKHPLIVFAGACLIAYMIWFLTGPSQRLRHLLPLYPLLLICFAVAAVRAASRLPAIDLPLKVACAAVIGIQLVGAAVFMINYLEYHILGQDDEAFLLRNVSEYNAVIAARPHLGVNDRVLVSNRQLVYHFDAPVFYANSMQQAVVAIHPKATNPRKLWEQLQTQNITHALLPFSFEPSYVERKKINWSYRIFLKNDSYFRMAIRLLELKCLVVVEKASAVKVASRTLPALRSSITEFSLAKLTPATCPYADSR